MLEPFTYLHFTYIMFLLSYIYHIIFARFYLIYMETY